MNAGWLQGLDPLALLAGFLAGAAVSALAAWLVWRKAAGAAAADIAGLRAQLQSAQQALAAARTDLAVQQARAEEQQDRFRTEKVALEAAEKRLSETFERLAGRVFEERSKRFTELSEKQLDTLLKPLSKDLDAFRKRVDETHTEGQKTQAALRERLVYLESLNQRLNEEAHNLTRALTADVKTQGGWGEQQLERMLELSGLRKGEHFHTQYSVTGRSGERLQPDMVLLLPENRTIIMDSKVSLTAWTRYQSAADDAEREQQIAEHTRSIRAHIDGLAARNYPAVEELNALDFVLMFVPIEAALIAALHHDPTLPEYALKKRVALLSPANFLATVRTVASVWMVHKQNSNAREIAERAGLLHDKFAGFVDNLKTVGARLDQAQRAYESAFSQLSTGSGNLVRQAQLLSDLGAKHQKQLDSGLVEQSVDAVGVLGEEQEQRRDS